MGNFKNKKTKMLIARANANIEKIGGNHSATLLTRI